MNIKGNIVDISDIKMYQGIAAIACRKFNKKDIRQIPTFIVDEAIAYYCSLEKYEVCNSIKRYFDKYTIQLVSSTREEWYGKKSQKRENQ